MTRIKNIQNILKPEHMINKYENTRSSYQYYTRELKYQSGLKLDYLNTGIVNTSNQKTKIF
jgi:hypothetical protein